MAKWLMILLLLTSPVSAAVKIPVDLELVLAVDVSSSMDKDEQKLQRDGYVAALRHPAILNALDNGVFGQIAITYFEWGGVQNRTTVLDWTLLKTRSDALKAAETLARTPIGRAPSTSISSALIAASQMIGENRYEGARKVIDISGDGPNNVGATVLAARQAVLAGGIEINGLPIMIKKRSGFQIDDLDIYYRECVIGGPRAFVVPVYDRNRLAATILQKMVLEIANLAPRRSMVHTVASRVDCMIGEKQRDEFMRSIGFD